MSEVKKCRAISAMALAVSICCCGCVSDDAHRAAIRSEIGAQRMSRFQHWSSERAGRPLQQQLVSGPLSLDECISLALRNSRELQTADQELVKAGATIMEAWSEALPTLDASADYTRLDNVASLGGIAFGDRNNYTLTATAKQPLYRGGLISAGIRGARLYDMYATEQRRAVYQTVIFDVRSAYYDARLAWELERAGAAAVEVARRLVSDTEKNLQAGTAAQFDLLRANVELKNATAEHVRDQNRLRLAQATLLNVIGVSQESGLPELGDPLKYQPFTPSREEAVRIAFQQHPDIMQAELAVRMQEEAVTAARSGYWPEVDAVFNETYSRPDPHNPTRIKWGEGWNAGVTLTFHLFEGFKTNARVKREKAALRQSRIALRDTEERLLLEIRQAMLSLADAEKLVESQEANIEQAEEALRLAELGFSQGVRKQVEVLDAHSARTRARANYAEAVYAHEMARLQFERAMGMLSAPDTVSE